MSELVQANWVLFLIALAIGILVAWWIFVASRRTKVELTREEGAEAGPAKRNQALIDAPPAAAAPPPAAPAPDFSVEAAAAELAPATPIGMAGAGEALLAGGSLAGEAPAEPEPMFEPAPATSELLRIKGLGPKLVDQLAALGVTRLDQVAAWDEAEIDRIDAQLGRFQGRIRRDDWPAQARLLAGGDVAAYEARFGRL